MEPVLYVWGKFILCAVLLVYSGYRLSQYADVIATHTGLSKTVMGLVFLAAATSLPEVATSIGAVTRVNSPDLAAGDVFGSVIINLSIIVLLDFISGKDPILRRVHTGQILYGALAIVMLGITLLAFISRHITHAGTAPLAIGSETYLLLFIYGIGMILIFLNEKHGSYDESDREGGTLFQPHPQGLIRGIIGFVLYFAVVVFGGVWIASIGGEIVAIMHWSETIVGTIFLGFSTSLGEIIVSVSALRLGSVNMAIGNILGSNFFDTMIIPLCDIAFRDGTLLAFLSLNHVITISLGMVLTGVVIAGIITRSDRSFFRIGIDVWALLFIVAAGMAVLVLLS